MLKHVFTIWFLFLRVEGHFVFSDSKDSEKSEKNSFPSCGGTYRDFQFIIESPNYPENYPDSTECIYNLESNCETDFHFQFLDFQVEASHGCSKDRLEIQDVDALCGSTIGIKKYTAKDGKLKLKFYSDENETAKGFKILITKEPCVQFGNTDIPYTQPHPKTHEPEDNSFQDERNYTNSFDERQSRGNFNPYEYPQNPKCYCPNDNNFNNGGSAVPTYPTFTPNGNFPYTPEYPMYPNFNQQFPVYNQGPNFFDQTPTRHPCVYYDNSQFTATTVPPVVTTENSLNINEQETAFTKEPENYQTIQTSLHPKYYHHHHDRPIFYPNVYPNYQPCCANIYNKKHFYISSPGFPYSGNHPSDCSFNIYRAHDNVCQLKIFFKFFWTGERASGNTCRNGFLQIDNKYFCGCQTGITVRSPFDQRWGNSPKVLNFKNVGLPRGSYNGFTLEIVQESCPTRRYVRDSQRSNDTGLRRLEDFGGQPKSKISIYYFAPPEEEDTVEFQKQEPRDYIDTSSSSNFFLLGGDILCKKWSIAEWLALSSLALFIQTGHCRRPGIPEPPTPTVPPINCERIINTNAVIQSPGYPNGYPPGLNLCYRFEKVPGYCGYILEMQDFDITPSLGCQIDYFQLNAFSPKECGNSLSNKILSIDLNNINNKNYNIAYFSSHPSLQQYRGKGFRARYRYQSCNEKPPIIPPTTPPPPPNACGRIYQAPEFTLQLVDGITVPVKCEYIIVKVNPNICGLLLQFFLFDLNCATEVLVIDGREYCGLLTNEQFAINFLHRELNIVYIKRNPPIGRGKFSIRAIQSADNCGNIYLNVPAERLSLESPGNVTVDDNQDNYTTTSKQL